MKNWNPNLDKAALLRHMGSVSQLGGLKRYTFAEGRAKGVEAVDVVTGTGFDFTVLPGRCMDLAWARYKGIPVSYMSKAEITVRPSSLKILLLRISLPLMMLIVHYSFV